MITRLLSILFLFSLSTFGMSMSAKTGTGAGGFFIIRSEWDDRCVAFMNNDLVLDANCKLAQSVWESPKGIMNNVPLKNYYGGKYLNFVRGNAVPQMIDVPTGNSKFNFQVVHPRNRRWPNNKAYWGVTYHVIRNSVTQLCLMVSGNVMRQLNCDPSKPEHLSFEEVPFNPAWVKSPERVATEAKLNPPVVLPPVVLPPVVLPPVVLPPVVLPPVVLPPVVLPPPINPPRRNCKSSIK